jgi:3-polyprenyl-4-hydroxybenzoate decarboxylase
VVSPAGWRNLGHELAMTPADLRPLADHVHDVDDVGATIASGSFRAAGMAVAPVRCERWRRSPTGWATTSSRAPPT